MQGALIILMGLGVGATLHVALHFYDTGRVLSWHELVLPAIGSALSMVIVIRRQKRASR